MECKHIIYIHAFYLNFTDGFSLNTVYTVFYNSLLFI